MKTRTALAVVGSLVATQAAALPCADSTHVENQLLALHGESLTHSGRLANSNILQLFQNQRSESWSIMVQVPSRGLTCMLSTGYGYEAAMSKRYFDNVNLTPMS